jgi:hypothetical protein
MLDPHVAAWALARIRENPQLAAEITAHLHRIPKSAQYPSERILRAEIISTIIGLTALIEGIGVSTAVAGAVGGAIVGVAISIGVNYAISALTTRSQGSGPIPGSQGSALATTDAASATINSQAVQIVERQAIPSKRIIYGVVNTSGVLFFEQVKPPFLYQGLMLCARPVTAFLGLQIGTQQIGFSAINPNTILTPIALSGQPNFPGRLRASFRLGSTSQAIDPLLAADFASLDAQFRQRGIATLVLRYDYGADFTEYTALWGQVSRPNPLTLVQGVAVPDPRNPSHVLQFDPSDPAATAAAEATWSYSNNAALVQTHYLIQRYGGRINPSRVNWDKVAKAADWDDGLVARKDGTYFKRHTIDGVVTLNQSPVNVMAGMIAANRGFILESAGRVWVSSSYPRTPIVTIYDGLLTGPVEYRAAKPKRDMANRIKVRFVAADREYQEVDGTVLSRSDYKTLDGELLDATLDLPFTMDTGNVGRVQRLQKAFIENSRLGRQIACTCDVALLADCNDDLVGNTVVFSSVLFAQANGTYFVSNWGFSDNFSSITLSLTEYNPSIETDYIAATDEQPFTLAPLNLT